MARSVARKKREHLVRQGKNDPAIKRGTWGSLNPIERTTPTLKAKRDRIVAQEFKSMRSGALGKVSGYDH